MKLKLVVIGACAGEVDTLSWRMYFMLKDEADGVARRISAWHQIPLWADGRGGKHELGAAVSVPPELKVSTPAWVLCMRGSADFEFRGSAGALCVRDSADDPQKV